MNVTAAQNANYSVSTPNTSLSVQAGQTLQIPLTATSTGGFSGTVSLAALNFSSFGLNTSYWSPTSISLSANGQGSATFYLITNSTATPGQYQITLHTTSGSLTHDIPVTVNVTAVTASVNGVSPSPVPGSTSNQTITITGSNFVSGATVTYYDTNGTAYGAHAASISNSNTIVDTAFDDNDDGGTWHVVVTNPGASASNKYPFSVQ